MSEEIKPKKERRFLKTLGRVGEILIQEVLIKLGSNLIKKIGGKKTLPSILFLLASLSLFAQYPATGNKQRLGFQTTGDGLTWRGSISDTASIQPINNQNTWVILDTINLKFYSFDFTSNTWNALPQGTNIDTTSLSNRINLKLNLSDTASMLTNYLRTGVAASTYLPLTGGTLTGKINRQEGSHNGSASTFYYNILDYFAKQDNIKYNPTAQITFTDRPGTSTSENLVRTSDIHLMTAKSFNGTSLGQYLDTTLSVVANQDGGRIGISKLNPAYKLDINGTFNASGNSLIGGTLGVTGAISSESILLPYNKSSGFSQLSIFQNANSFVISGGTGGIQFNNNTNSNALVKIFNNGNFKISNNQTDNGYKFEVDGTTGLQGTLTVNSSAVFNEGSADADFRVESDGNADMVFVDASTDRVGIGTNAPTKTLDVNGEVKISTVTATPTSLLGKDGSNVVGEVTDINQSGVMKVGGITATTNSVGGINVAHGLSYTPSKVIATIAQLNSYVIVLRGITSSNLEFTIYDSTTGVGLNSVSVGFYWIAFK